MDSKIYTSTLVDRRSVPRFAPNPATACRVSTTEGSDDQSAVIHNISARGINVLVKDRYEVGTILMVNLTNPSNPFMNRSVTVRVARISEPKDGMYGLGCEFMSPVNGHELLALAL